MGAKTELHVQYWKADDHQWGSGKGKVHLIHEDGTKLLCGRLLSDCPGRYVRASEYEYNCRACAGVLDSRARREQERLRSEALARDYAREEAERRANWKIWYDGYLRSPKWREKADAVLVRENYICEACRRRRATQVHHTTYAHVGNEPLFELRAICRECHEWLTAEDRRQRGEVDQFTQGRSNLSEDSPN